MPFERKTLAKKKAKDAEKVAKAGCAEEKAGERVQEDPTGEEEDFVQGDEVEPGLYIQPGDYQEEVDGQGAEDGEKSAIMMKAMFVPSQ